MNYQLSISIGLRHSNFVAAGEGKVLAESSETVSRTDGRPLIVHTSTIDNCPKLMKLFLSAATVLPIFNNISKI